MRTGSDFVRVVAVGNRIRLVSTEAAYVTELRRIVALAVPHLAPDRPNLLVLTELLGLPAALTGRRAAPARHASSARAALMLLASAYLPRLLAYRRRWRDVSLPRALLLARADVLYRPLADTLARLAVMYRTHIVATTLAPRVRRSTDPRAIARWGRSGAAWVALPDGPAVFNVALVFGPDGALLERVEKVFLTAAEKTLLDLAPGRLEDVRVIPTAAGRLGVAISLDAFTPAYLRHIEAHGAQIVVQPDANDQPWAAPSATSDWQPAEWLGSVLGSIQPGYPSLRHNVCAMQTGNIFDLVFDGQSSITSRARAPAAAPACIVSPRFVGVDEPQDPRTGARLAGDFLTLAPWVVEDPVFEHPRLTLAERRDRLAAVARQLLPGGSRANAYRESVIWADLDLQTDG